MGFGICRKFPKQVEHWIRQIRQVEHWIRQKKNFYKKKRNGFKYAWNLKCMFLLKILEIDRKKKSVILKTKKCHNS